MEESSVLIFRTLVRRRIPLLEREEKAAVDEIISATCKRRSLCGLVMMKGKFVGLESSATGGYQHPVRP